MSAIDLAYLNDLLFPAESPAGIAVNTAILLLFAVGLLDVVIALVSLARERQVAHRAGRRAKEEMPVGSFASGDEVLSSLAISPSSLLGRRIFDTLRLRNAGPGEREVLRHLTAEQLAGLGAIARYVGTILTLLGLFGTVLGLSFALLKIYEALGSVGDLAAFDELALALGQTLQGMRTAFATTLAGLGTALMLSCGNFIVRRWQSRVHCAIERLVTCDLLPLLQPADPDADAAARSFAQLLTDAAQGLERAREQFAEAVSRYGEASAEVKAASLVFQAGCDGFGDRVDKLLGQQKSFTKTMKDAGAAVQSLEATSARQLDELRSFLELHLEHLKTVVGEHRQATAELLGTERSSLEAFRDLIVDLRLQLTSLLERPDPAAALAASLEANQALLADLGQLANRFQPAVLEYHKQFQTALEGALAKLESGMEKLAANVHQQAEKGLSQQTESHRQAFAEALQRHREELRSITSEHQHALAKLLGDQGTALRAFSDLVVDVHSNMGPSWGHLPPAAGSVPQRQEPA